MYMKITRATERANEIYVFMKHELGILVYDYIMVKKLITQFVKTDDRTFVVYFNGK